MLRGVNSLLTPELLYVLALMGHGDEIAIVDANFPAQSIAIGTPHGKPVVVAGASTPEVLGAVLSVLPLDGSEPVPVRVMSSPDVDPLPVHQEIQALVSSVADQSFAVRGVERFAFYEATRSAYAVVQTGERRPYGNVLVRKGVVVSPET